MRRARAGTGLGPLMVALLACGGPAEGPGDPGDSGAATETEDSSSGSGASGGSTTAESAGGGSDPSTTMDGDATGGPQDDTGCDARPICTRAEDTVTCPHQTVVYRTGATALTEREVHWQVPDCPAPAAGRPVAIMFQGSAFSSELNWVGAEAAPFGMIEQVTLLSNLLDAGFVVITPEAHLEGSTFWDTNVPPFSLAWETSADHRLMLALLEGLAAGDFGPVDLTRMVATGISSGGYMTSRMAVSYPGRFRALAIASASYATCGGPACLVPDDLPADHPPTLFLHGGDDLIVPLSTMTPYADALSAQGTEVAQVIDPDAGHEWLDTSPDDVLAWFRDHT